MRLPLTLCAHMGLDKGIEWPCGLWLNPHHQCAVLESTELQVPDWYRGSATHKFHGRELTPVPSVLMGSGGAPLVLCSVEMPSW